jgi:predicted nucleic acid-binding Zn ribbon protein
MSRECKACGTQVPDQATTCPNCGAVLAAKMKLLPLAAFMLIVILIIQSYINKEGDGAAAVEPAVPASSAEQ